MSENCPNKHNHTPCPDGYLQWHAWAEQMSKTHKQMRCTGCGLFTIWIDKKDDPYNDVKIWHRANKINDKGEASALCYVKPRPIPKNVRWTTDDNAVTCLKCLKIINAALAGEEKQS